MCISGIASRMLHIRYTFKTYITVTQTGYQATATLVQKGWNGRLPGADGSYNAGDWAPEGEYTFSVRGRGVIYRPCS